MSFTHFVSILFSCGLNWLTIIAMMGYFSRKSFKLFALSKYMTRAMTDFCFKKASSPIWLVSINRLLKLTICSLNRSDSLMISLKAVGAFHFCDPVCNTIGIIAGILNGFLSIALSCLSSSSLGGNGYLIFVEVVAP